MKAKLITRNIQALKPRPVPYDVRDTELSGFLLRVLPTGTMNYFCDYRRPDGRRTRVKIGDAAVLTPAQARDEALKILGAVARKEDPSKERKAARQETFERFITRQYQPWVEAHRKTGAQTVKRALVQFSDFKGDRLSDLSPWKVEKWRSAHLKAGLAATTVNRNVTMLKAILEKAVEWDVLEFNPLRKVKPLRVDQSAKIRYLEAEEESDLRAQLDKRETRIRLERRSYNAWCLQRGYPKLQDLDAVSFADYLKPMFLLAINTGLRRGEVFNLKWTDLDFKRRLLTVAGVTAKSGKTRHVPLNDEAYLTLEKWRSQSSEDHDIVFVSPNGGRFDNIQTSWETVLSDAKIKKFRWHDLRHHFASMLVMNGVDLNTVRELLGHGDIKMTLRYAHLAPQVKANAVAKLDANRNRRTTVLEFNS